MISCPRFNCWELMNCDNLDCPARREPQIPCWEIARRSEAYHNVSNTCRDCVVYILKAESSVSSIKMLQNAIIKREQFKDKAAGHQICF